MPSKLVTDKEKATMSRLAGTLRLLRAEKKLSIRELAEQVGVSHSDVYRLENGTTGNPSIFLINKVATFYGLTVDELMSFNAKPCPTCGGSGWIREERKK